MLLHEASASESHLLLIFPFPGSTPQSLNKAANGMDYKAVVYGTDPRVLWAGGGWSGGAYRLILRCFQVERTTIFIILQLHGPIPNQQHNEISIKCNLMCKCAILSISDRSSEVQARKLTFLL